MCDVISLIVNVISFCFVNAINLLTINPSGEPCGWSRPWFERAGCLQRRLPFRLESLHQRRGAPPRGAPRILLLLHIPSEGKVSYSLKSHKKIEAFCEIKTWIQNEPCLNNKTSIGFNLRQMSRRQRVLCIQEYHGPCFLLSRFCKTMDSSLMKVELLQI